MDMAPIGMAHVGNYGSVVIMNPKCAQLLMPFAGAFDGLLWRNSNVSCGSRTAEWRRFSRPAGVGGS
jgi:hypothetical protein